LIEMPQTDRGESAQKQDRNRGGTVRNQVGTRNNILLALIFIRVLMIIIVVSYYYYVIVGPAVFSSAKRAPDAPYLRIRLYMRGYFREVESDYDRTRDIALEGS
jgi:hypothetical protein